jgi:GGDEF domain-containing protein
MSDGRTPGEDGDRTIDDEIVPVPRLDPGPEPSADTVEALVRSIQVKEAGTPPPVASTDGPTPPRAIVVASGRQADVRPISSHPGLLQPGEGPIAGLIGRLEWDRVVADESERQQRYGRPGAIVMIELGGLDQAVALTGPRVIARVVRPCGETLVSIARASDRVTRLRDGRFGVLLRETDADGASRYASRAIDACDPWLAAMPWPLKLVVGWASATSGEDLVAAGREAERRMLAASPGPGKHA